MISPCLSNRGMVEFGRPVEDEDSSDVRRQDHVKRALEIAAVGGRNYGDGRLSRLREDDAGEPAVLDSPSAGY